MSIQIGCRFFFSPGNDTWLTCFRILFERSVYSSDGSSSGLSHFTIGISTEANFTDGCSFTVVFFEAAVIFSKHLIWFSSLHNDSTVNKPAESPNFRRKFNNVVRVISIMQLYFLKMNTNSLIILFSFNFHALCLDKWFYY